MSTISAGTTNVNSFIVSTDTTGNLVLQSSGSSITLSNTANTIIMGGSVITSGTAQASTSGTSIDFTGIPSWVKKITVMFNGVSTNGTSPYQVQIGSSSYTVTGYNSLCEVASSSLGSTTSTTGFAFVYTTSAAELVYGSITLCNISSNIWVQNGTTIRLNAAPAGAYMSGGSVSLGGVLDRIRVTTVIGTDTFDAGSINILYE